MKDKKIKINPSLTEEQKNIVFNKGTEYPFTGEYLYDKEEGEYHCIVCNNLLFKSDKKYDSNSGWPSFTDAIKGAVKLEQDNSHGMVRTEVTCANCGAHLGHLFEDGPKEAGGMRYCINSLSLYKSRQKGSNKVK